ncbi:MAG: hypothetical protein C0625_13075 [Arcobacter sp.]|nr:MAG: hypothetical protein C0625_13075 [Arcobacter sp.]
MQSKKQENKISSHLQVNEIKSFIKENSYLIYQYINTEILKNIGIMNPDYYVKIIKDIFVDKTNIEISADKANPNIIPYLLFTLFSDNGKIEYTSSRVETINFTPINKESSTYYNYVQFSLKDNFLWVELMQNKIGGMPIPEDIVKFTKKIPINPSGLEEFLIKNNKYKKENKYLKIEKAINNIL